MAENAIDVLAREEEEKRNSTSAPLPPSYQTPTPKKVEESGGLQPITADQQAKGGNDYFGDLKTLVKMPESPDKVVAKDGDFYFVPSGSGADGSVQTYSISMSNAAMTGSILAPTNGTA